MNRFQLLSCLILSLTFFSCKKKLTLVCSEATMVIKDDAEKHRYSNRNFGNNPRILAFAWTSSGLPTFGKSLLRFDLSAIPANKTIAKATLKLYGDTTVLNELTTRMEGKSNAFYLRRITGNWDEDSVTWMTQPAVSTDHQVTVPQSKSETGSQDYSIDVTELVNAIRENNKGIMIQLVEEESYSRVSFASDDAPKKPTLIIALKRKGKSRKR